MGSKFENIREVRKTDAGGARAVERAAACAALRQAFSGCTLAFFGLAVVRIWIQCNLYGNYVLSDAGLVSVVINFVRIAFTVLLVAFALRGLLGRRFAKALEWFSVTAMTLGSVLFFLNRTLASDAVLYAACTCAGLGIVWGGGMWMAFYLRLRPRTALLCALGTAGIGVVGRFRHGRFAALDVLSGRSVSAHGFIRVLRAVDARGRRARMVAGSERRLVVARVPLSSRSPRRRMGRNRASISCVCWPDWHCSCWSWACREVFRSVNRSHCRWGCSCCTKGGVVVLCGVWAWAALCRGRAVSSATLWRFEVVAASAGVVLMATLEWWGACRRRGARVHRQHHDARHFVGHLL